MPTHELSDLERTIADGRAHFAAVASALRVIVRESRYRERGYETFHAYAVERLGMSSGAIWRVVGIASLAGGTDWEGMKGDSKSRQRPRSSTTGEM